MSNFDEAYKIGIINEGGYNHISGDRGGRTYCGVAENDWPESLVWKMLGPWIESNGEPRYNEKFTNNDIPGIEDAVKDFYTENFWNKMHGGGIASKSVAIFFYDWFINSMTVATKHLQQVLGITADGVFGSGTLQSVNAAGEGLLIKLHASRDAFYASHVQAVPGDAKFLSGWNARSDGLYNKLIA